MTASLDRFAREKLAALEGRSARRRLRPGVADARSFVPEGGERPLLAFASNDYLGLAGHPALLAAAEGALRAGGASARASRLVVGTSPECRALEAELADLKGTEAACVFGSGYHVNLGVIPALVGPEDGIYVDALAHACLFSGARLSRARVEVFPHDDVGALADRLSATRASVRHAMVLTEGVFSMDGDAASLAGIAAACRAHDAWLLVDDAHATGVMGPRGAGSAAAAGLDPEDVPLQVGTLSKALGGYGGYLAASEAVIDLMITRARTLIYSTGLPPATVAAARAALRVVETEPDRRRRPVAHARRVAAALGLPRPAAAVLPVPVPGGDNETALTAQVHLRERGLWVPAMRPPTVPEGTARLRLSFSAAHTDEDVDRLLEGFGALGWSHGGGR